MRARALCPALLLAACGGESPVRAPDDATTAPVTRPPDIVVITLDTTRADALSPYGADATATPVVTRLANEGLRFDRAYTVTPLTIPAHSSLFTGLLPPRHGVRDNGDHFLSDGATTLAEHLQGAGYATMAAVGAEVTSHHWGFAQGFDAYFDDMGEAASGERNRWRVERRGDAVADDAIGWLKGRGAAPAPVFLWMHLFDAHHPYEPPDATSLLFPSSPYQAEVAYADMQVGRLIAALEERDPGLAHTWVFLLADHGESMGAHGEGMHGVLLYDETMRIPLVVRPAGGLPGSRIVRAPTSIVDVFPTALSVAGLPIPADLDGRDLSGWAHRGEGPPKGAGERAVYMESLYGWHHYGWAPQRALVDLDHKLIDSPTAELYRRDDPREARDLAQKQPSQTTAMRERIDRLAAGLVPLEGASGAASLSPERMSQLEALGYVTSASDASGDVPWRDAALPDPVARIPSLRRNEGVRQALQANDLDRARELAEALIADEPGLVDPARTLAGILLRQGDLDGAERILADLEARQPSSQNKAMLGNVHLRRGDLAGAADLFAAAIDLDPYLASHWVPYLHALWLVGDLERLAAEVQRARTHIPDHPTAMGMDGVLAAMASRCATAMPLLDAAIAAHPSQPFVQHARGMCLRSTGDAADAEEALLAEIALNDKALPSRRALVEMFAEQKRYDEQLEQLAVIEGIERPHALTAHSKAQALYNLQRYDAAQAGVLRCMELAPTYPHCVMLYANVLKKLGEEEKAVEVYHEALALANQAPPDAAAPDAPPPVEDPERLWKE